MTKPIRKVQLITMDGRSKTVSGRFDTGSFHTIVRPAALPEGAVVSSLAHPEELRTAAAGGRLRVTGAIVLYLQIGRKRIREDVDVSPDLSRDLLIGAGTMQKWDITVRNTNGSTEVVVGRHVADPEVTEVA